MKPVYKELKVIDLIESLDYLAELEAKEKSVNLSRDCLFYSNGEDSIKKRLLDLIVEDQHGNQRFNNDSFYRWTDVEEPPTADVELFLEHFGDAINVGSCDYKFILFNVSW